MKGPDGKNYYDNSMLDKYRACPRQFYFSEVRHWKPEQTSHDLIFGLCWHAAMDIVWLGANKPGSDDELAAAAYIAFMEKWQEYYPEQQTSVFVNESEDDKYPKTPGRALEMLHYYIQTHREKIAKYTIIGVELPFIVPLHEEGHNVFETDTYYIGRKDKVYRGPEDLVYDIDHKTTKTDKDSWRATFSPNSQIDGYIYSGFILYGKEYWGIIVDGALIQKGSAKTAKPGFPPGIGFPTIPLLRQFAVVESWLWDTTYLVKRLEVSEQMLAECKPGDRYLRAFERQTTACGYYKGCIYRTVCSFVENPMQLEEPPLGFKYEEWHPFELLDDTKDIIEGEGGE